MLELSVKVHQWEAEPLPNSARATRARSRRAVRFNARAGPPIIRAMRITRLCLVVVALTLAGCGDAPPPERAAVAVAPVPELTPEDRAVWRPARADGDAIPVLLYHAIAEHGDVGDRGDAFYAVRPGEFAKQMALLEHAGYRAITLEQFRRFHAGERVDLPAHPILITFDDGRADSLRNADPVLARLGWSAVMFVDVGAVAGGATGYAGWEELAAMQRSGRWSIQLHAGRGHHSIRYGDGERDVGPFYAYRDVPNGETLSDWRRRAIGDIEWGERELRRRVPGYAPFAFAPPYGAYGQLDTNDPAIPRILGRELRRRFGIVFVQADPHPARPGEPDVTRFQLDRTITGGALHHWLESG
jgi:peptidoglycan/xylan/chitin deacetylase (PgdA/CDA1 family)